MTYRITATIRHGSTILDGDMVEYNIERIAFNEKMRDEIMDALNTLGAVEIHVVRQEKDRAAASNH